MLAGVRNWIEWIGEQKGRESLKELAKTSYIGQVQCCGAGPFLSGSGFFFSTAPAPIKSRLSAIKISFDNIPPSLLEKFHLLLLLVLVF